MTKNISIPVIDWRPVSWRTHSKPTWIEKTGFISIRHVNTNCYLTTSKCLIKVLHQTYGLNLNYVQLFWNRICTEFLMHFYEETWPRSPPSLTRGPRTDMFQPGIEPGPPWWKASTLEKSHSKSWSIAIRNIYIWACELVENARGMATPSAHVYEHTWTWTCMNYTRM